MKRRILQSISEWSGQGVLSVLGPTGSGKTRCVLEWVRAKYPQQPKHPLLVSVDAVAVYRGLDVGSAKPLGAERSDYDWAGLDLCAPHEQVTALEFAKALKAPIAAALQAHRPVILVGGSHFYERALVEGPAPGAASDPAFQKTLESIETSRLHARLCQLDARWATRAHVNDRYRITRFLDLAERQSLNFDQLQAEPPGPGIPGWNETATLILGLDLSPRQLETKLRTRIEDMFAAGWLNEVQSLLVSGVSPTAAALQSVGYREIVEHLQGKLSAAELPDKILISHRQLAKKQRTWLRNS